MIPLRDGGALALTTAKYYTPSGRLIQRDYSNLEDYFLDAELEDDDAQRPADPESTGHEVRRTDSGRTVYGGGESLRTTSFAPSASPRFSRVSAARISCSTTP